MGIWVKSYLEGQPLDPDVDELLDGGVEALPAVLFREQLDLLHDVDAPPGVQIRRVEVSHGRIHGLLVGLALRGDLGTIDGLEAAHGAEAEVARGGLVYGCSAAGGGEEAVAVGVDLAAVVEAEDDGLGVGGEGGGGLPGDAAVVDLEQAAALLVVEGPDGAPGGRGWGRGWAM